MFDMCDIIQELDYLDSKYGWSKKYSVDDIVAEQDHDQNKPSIVVNIDTGTKRFLVAPPSSTPSKLKFPRQKYDLTKSYFSEINRLAFDSQLPSDMEVKWSKRLTKTAGYTRLKRPALSINGRTASIELSEKVLDDEDRLRQTLGHEMCHAAQWLIDGVNKPPHGDCFWKWARQLERRVPGMKVTTCHSYDINAPFKFACTNDSCCKVYSRHSRKGIDVNRHACGVCKSTLIFKGEFLPDGTPKKTKPASGFSLFVKEHYASVKATQNIQKHGDVMSALSIKYRDEKEQHQQNTILVGADITGEDIIDTDEEDNLEIEELSISSPLVVT